MAFSLIQKMAAFEIQTRGHMTPPPPQGGGYSTNVYAEKLLPEVQPLTLLYTIFSQKRYPFCIPSIDNLLTNGTPFTYLV